MLASLAGAVLTALMFWFLFPFLGRLGGGLFAVLGLIGLSTHQEWGAWCFAGGAALWFAGHWIHATKTGRYAGSLALLLFEHTPLKWTLWQHWRAAAWRRRQRATVSTLPYDWNARTLHYPYR